MLRKRLPKMNSRTADTKDRSIVNEPAPPKIHMMKRIGMTIQKTLLCIKVYLPVLSGICARLEALFEL